MNHVVVLAGGGGTRLWPASTRSRPKQFLALGRSGKSLLRETADRLRNACEDRIWIVTTADQVPQVRSVLPELPVAQIVVEPVGRNTAAAIGLAAVHVRASDPNAVIGVMPSDQTVTDPETFTQTVVAAFSAAAENPRVVTVAITPTRPETGYGYMELGETSTGGVHAVKRFVEKPNLENAKMYLASGNFAWNAGIFFAQADVFIKKIAQHLPASGRILAQIADCLASEGETPAKELTEKLYVDLDPVSIDYGVLEKESDILSVTGDFGWSDMGAWDAIADVHDPDDNGNYSIGTCLPVDSRNNIAVGEKDHLVVLLGVEDLVVVQTEHATLVTKRDKSQSVRDVVDKLTSSELKRFR